MTDRTADINKKNYAENNNNSTGEINDNTIVIQYFKDLSQIPLLTNEEEIKLITSFKNGNIQSKQKLIEANLRLVVSVAKKYIKSGVPLMDLIQDGNMGLIHALEKYDLRHQNRFSTYAVWQIRHYIRRAIANKSRLIRIPVNLIEKKNRLEQIADSIMKDEGREPSIDELAKLTNIPRRKIRDILCYFQPLLSLEITSRSETDSLAQDYERDMDLMVSSNSELPEVQWYTKFLQEELLKALSRLDERECVIFRHYYGLNEEGRDYTLKELGKIFKLTRERIRQIKNIATRKIKDYFTKFVIND